LLPNKYEIEIAPGVLIQLGKNGEASVCLPLLPNKYEIEIAPGVLIQLGKNGEASVCLPLLPNKYEIEIAPGEEVFGTEGKRWENFIWVEFKEVGEPGVTRNGDFWE
jgi:hypothetical protein